MILVDVITHAVTLLGGGAVGVRAALAYGSAREQRRAAQHAQQAAAHGEETARHRAITVGIEVTQETFRAALQRLASLERTLDAVNDARTAERESCAARIAALETELKAAAAAHARELESARSLIDGLSGELRELRAHVLEQGAPRRFSDPAPPPSDRDGSGS